MRRAAFAHAHGRKMAVAAELKKAGLFLKAPTPGEAPEPNALRSAIHALRIGALRRVVWRRRITCGRPLRSSRTRASPSPADIRYDNQAVAVGPILSTQIVPGKIRGWWRRSEKAPEVPAMSAAQRGNGVSTGGHGAFGMTAVVKRIGGHAVDIGGSEITFSGPGGLAPGDAFELALAT
jgi:hypothetical protein